jgi:SMC interacting uncharacterized protein involved in chromosome segregation
MRFSLASGILAGILFVSASGSLLASEVDVLRERAASMRQKAAALAELGKNEQAEQLAKESAELLEAAEKMESASKGPGKKGKFTKDGESKSDSDLTRLHQRLQELHGIEKKLKSSGKPGPELVEVQEQIERLQSKLKQLHARHDDHKAVPPDVRAQAEKLEAVGRRISHLRVAAQNLKQADEHELAQRMSEKADVMERDLHEARRRMEMAMHEAHERRGEARGGGEIGPETLQKLVSEIERLRAEVRELRDRIEK